LAEEKIAEKFKLIFFQEFSKQNCIKYLKTKVIFDNVLEHHLPLLRMLTNYLREKEVVDNIHIKQIQKLLP